jgi:GT2 family glycosyltransferase
LDAHAIISPFRFVSGRGLRIKKASPGIHSFNDLCIINSGMLISLEVFYEVNGFDERFPLDLSDIVFTERVRQRCPDFVLTDAVCYHHFSAVEKPGTVEEGLMRFKKYADAVMLYRKLNHLTLPGFTILFRSLKLSVKYRSMKFVRAGLMTLFERV